jgi:hypothetical protein
VLFRSALAATAAAALAAGVVLEATGALSSSVFFAADLGVILDGIKKSGVHGPYVVEASAVLAAE